MDACGGVVSTCMSFFWGEQVDEEMQDMRARLVAVSKMYHGIVHMHTQTVSPRECQQQAFPITMHTDIHTTTTTSQSHVRSEKKLT